MTQLPVMSGLGWRLVETISKLLERDDREAIQGDLLEAGESPWKAAVEVAGLVLRRQAALWKTWRPWLAAFGLAFPSSLLLMGLSVSVSQSYQHLLNPAIHRATGVTVSPALWFFFCNVVLLVGWSWSGGYVVGSLSRRTVWVSAILSSLPFLFCLSRFNVESLPRFCLLLFLAPAVWGVRRGLRLSKFNFEKALALAIALTLLTIPTWGHSGAWIPHWALSWPAWFLVATARRPNRLLRKETHDH
jgi:hypothetical protein